MGMWWNSVTGKLLFRIKPGSPYHNLALLLSANIGDDLYRQSFLLAKGKNLN